MLKLGITDFLYNDELMSPRLNDTFDYHVPEAKRVELPDNDAVFSFRFASLNYQLQHRVHYQYKLEGYDSQWHQVGKDRTVSFSNIPSGKYTLRIRASLLELPDKYDEKSIEIVIPQPFLLSSSAIWIYMLLFVIIGISFMLWKQKRAVN